jgi:hypothetical protein
MRLRIDRDLNLRGSQLPDHRIEIAHAEIDHPLFVRPAKVIGILRERGKDSRTCFLRSRLMVVIARGEIDSELIPIPSPQSGRIPGAKEQPPNPSRAFHTIAT